MSWLSDVYNGNEYWVEDAEDKYPCVISFEYRRLRKMCQDSKSYGVLLCLKDNYEALLKFETLISYAWAVEKIGGTFENSTISRIATPQLSFGAWLDLAKLIIRDLKNINMELPTLIPLNMIVKLYEKYQLVKWRNDKIGHGVMGFDEDEQFQKDIISHIEIYTTILKKIDEQLRAQRLFVIINGNTIDLTGADIARNIPGDGELVLTLVDGSSNKTFCVNPFLKLSPGYKTNWGIYFFDNQKKVTISVFQAYAEGLTNNMRDGYFEHLARCLTGNKVCKDNKASNRYKTFEEYRELDAQISREEYVVPEHILKWIQNCIGKYEKGTFLLEMGRGMGKSVFTDRLNCLFDKPTIISEDLDVRTYHLNRIQSAGIDDFYLYIHNMWSMAYNSSPYMGIPSIKELIQETGVGSTAFSEYLSCVLNSRRERDYKKKILMVFDGIDEVVTEQVKDMVLINDSIPEGVYILFTSRNPTKENLPEPISEFICNMPVTEKIEIDMESVENIDFLKMYISRQGIREDNIKERMVRASSYRILDLSLLCALYKKNKSIQELEQADSFVEMYIKYIQEQYTEKEFYRLKEILAIIALLGDKDILTLKKIGEISSENQITIRLVGIMADLSPLLEVDRNSEGNAYRIVNEDISKELLEQIPEKEMIIRKLIETIKAILSEKRIPDLQCGDETLCTHMFDLASMLPEGVNNYTEENESDIYNLMMEVLEWSDNGIHEIMIQERYLYQIYRYYSNKYGIESDDTIIAMISLADMMVLRGAYRDALDMYNVLLDKWGEVSKIPEQIIDRVLYDISLLYIGLGEFNKNIELYEEVLSFENWDIELYCLFIINVAYSYALQLKTDIAKELVKEIVEDRELFPEISDASKSSIFTMITNIYILSGDGGEALASAKEGLLLAKKVYGEDSYRLAEMEGIVASLSGMEGNYEEGVIIEKRVYDKLVKQLGSDHPNTIFAEMNYAILVFASGKCEEGICIAEDAEERLQNIYGKEHYLTTMIENSALFMEKYLSIKMNVDKSLEQYNIANIKYGSCHKITLEKQETYLRALFDYIDFEYKYELDKELEDSKILIGIFNVYKITDCNKTIQVGEDLYDKEMLIYGSDSEYTIRTMIILAYIYDIAEDFERAIVIQEKVVEAFEKRFGEVNENNISSINKLIDLYTKAGDKDKIEIMQEKLKMIEKYSS